MGVRLRPINIAQNPGSTSWYAFANTVEVPMLCGKTKSWENRYMQTILEVNGQKMPERITATRQAIAGRLRDLEHDSDHHAERHQIKNALRALSKLEGEVRAW